MKMSNRFRCDKKGQDRKMLIKVKRKIISALFWGSILLLFTNKLVSKESVHFNGYTDIVLFRDKYIAVGTDGRIDCINKLSGKATIDNSSHYKLNGAYANDEILIAVGDHGTILYSTDGKSLCHAESGTDKNIHGITIKNGLYIAGTESGTILTSKDGISWSHIQTKAKGTILSISSNNSFLIGVTDTGEIIKSIDGINWEVKDYNKEYAGYNPHSKFKKILAVQNSIVIIGIHDDGSPSILFSSLGNVWAERIPVYKDDQGKVSYLTTKPSGITYDPDRDQFILACDKGELFSLSNCTKCNKYIKISESDLNALIYVDNCLLIVGADYSMFIQRL
jgi:hypothetical protein